MSDFFISDLHLREGRQDLSLALDSFLQNQASQAKRLYILGDLFEYWLGDDAASPYQRTILRRLKDYAKNHSVYFMRGNRDFLIGTKFAQESGISLLDDPTLIESYGKKILLTHGDILCTMDSSYLAYRKIIQHPITKGILSRLPVSLRISFAEYIRKKSVQSGKKKTRTQRT